MKQLFLLVSLLSASAFASTSDLKQQAKDLYSNELYKQHHIQIIKEEKHRFLFFPYTKQVIINDVKLIGTDVIMRSQTQTPYIQSVKINENNQTVINSDFITTGLIVSVKKLENSNKQTINISNSELVSLDNCTSSSNDNQCMNIPLATVRNTDFSESINQNHFEKNMDRQFWNQL